MNRTVVRCSVAALSLLLAGVLLAQDAQKAGGKPPVEEEEAPKKKPDDAAKGKKPPADEEEAPKTKKPPPKDDEEEAPAKPKKPVPREDDTPPVKPRRPIPREDDTPPKPPGAAAAAPDKVDFAAEAARTTHPDLKRLYQAVAQQADHLLLRGNTEPVMVEPVPEYVGAKANAAPLRYRPLTPDGRPGTAAYTANPGGVVRGVSYEERALEAASDFVVDMQKYPAGHPRYLPAVQYLGIADQALTAVLKFHDDARGGGRRKGPGWDAVQDHIRAKLLDVLSDELRALIASSEKGAAEKAAEVAGRLRQLFPDSVQAQREVAMWELSQVNNDLSVNDEPYFKAARTLHDLEVKFPTAGAKVLDSLRDALKRRAQAHFDEAKRLAATEDGKPAAQRQLDMAMKIWPETPGLSDYQVALARDFRLLVVGVKRLPELMSPPLAVTDADRWAGELLFEGLVRPVPDAAVGHRYQPGLALRLPRTIAMGREFELPRDAVWVGRDGKVDKLDASDVRGTLAMMQEQSKLPFAASVDLLAEPSIQDAYRFPLRLERGCLDPLGAMAFKILPARLLANRPDRLLNREFAQNPVGSGPFVYHGRRSEDGREYAVFKSNPEYSKRTGRFGRPLIQEVRFVVPPADPVNDLRDGRIDLLLDVPTAQMVRLRDPAHGLAMAVSDHTLWSRRIWMLAVNHRKPELGADGRPLRRAIAFAINRDDILTGFKAGTQSHRVLNGPFPPDTWAAPESPRPLLRPEQAQFDAKSARLTKLSLKFVDDPLSAQACAKIKEQVAAVGITLDLLPMNVADFHRDVMLEHNYELAYMPYDYQSELFPLRGLFDPNAVERGQQNFLGYQPDAKIGQLLSRLAATRDFTKVRDAARELYTSFDDQMPFVPLWQLDFHLVASRKLETLPGKNELDPLTIFDMIEEWRLNR